MAETLEELVRKRGVLKGHLTRFKNFLDTLDKENPDLVQLELRVNKSQFILGHFEDVQMKIELLDEDAEENSEQHEIDRNEFEQNYFALHAQAKRILLSVNPTVVGQGVQSGTNNNNNSNINSIKLPTINLPSFDGSYSQWLYFKDTFSSIIHKNNTISDIQKFHYLRLSLKGEAADIVRSLEISSDNYNSAWTLLQNRYENKVLLVNNHVKALFNLPVVHKESHSALRLLLDSLNKHLKALEVLGQPVDQWDTLVIFMVSSKLDSVTRREWEIKNTSSPTKLSTLEELKTFLNERCSLLETLTACTSSQRPKSFLVAENKNQICKFCAADHYITKCTSFLNLTAEKRYLAAKEKHLCTNCLKGGHSNKSCLSIKCKICSKRHHTLLHNSNNTDGAKQTNSGETDQTQISVPTIVAVSNDIQSEQNQNTFTLDNQFSHIQAINQNQILLSTAIIQVLDKYGKYHYCRALLDSGSTSHLITQEFADKLNLNQVKTHVSVSGVNESHSNITHYVTVKLKSNISSYQTNIHCLVISKITNHLPSISFDKNIIDIPHDISLADPNFNESSNIDLLIGADLFWQILRMGQITLGKNKPIIQNTLFGWVLSGQIPHGYCNFIIAHHCHSLTDIELHQSVNKFWEIEEYPNIMPLTDEERSAEDFFKSTTKRDATGRFVVRLPLNHYRGSLGDSRQLALKRLFSIETKLNKDEVLRKQYVEFMDEYAALNHMSKIDNFDNVSSSYYIPHHFVKRDTSLTTKLRVVFDASMKTTTGISLNDLQLVGPTIQQDLVSILLRFRSHKYILAGDVTKMYRQIMIHEDDRRLQRILWRSDPSQPIETFELNTVTYGTSSAPFLAIRCLHEIGIQNKIEFPLACEVILRDFYVDDLLTGSDDIDTLKILYRDITSLFVSYGFSLNKWISNNTDILENIKNNQPNCIINIGDNYQTNSLGLFWHSNLDILKYNIKKFMNYNRKPTKRMILSTVAQIFDPLGLVGPVIIKAKCLLQTLWQLKVSWDEPLPLDISYEWNKFQENLHYLNDIQVPRFVLCDNPNIIEIHGFADACESGYGACIYIKTINKSDEIHVNLLCAKSKVAPLKCLTIPKLELCAALLLAKLFDKLKSAWNIKSSQVFFWSDSTIVLGWINGTPTMWKVFVANRVSNIQALTNKKDWRHVVTGKNPADMISRGLDPQNLSNNKLWWYGPDWLSHTSNKWPIELNSEKLPVECFTEVKKQMSIISIVNSDICTIFDRFSSFVRLQRTVAYILRFENNSRPNSTNISGPLSPQELKHALVVLLRLVQKESFPSELKNLKMNKSIEKNSKLLQLNPFLDSDEVIRVGGRLKYSNYDMDKKHPIVLPNNHKMTKLLVNYQHKILCHAGPQLLLASLREKYWVINGRNLIRKIVHDCITCYKTNPILNAEYLMADLPELRVSPARPFVHVGIDYCGPFNLRDRKTRNFKVTKTYVCVFICFSTKAAHLELVSDMTSQAFLACLHRFMARRGKCNHVFSDNGTNFVGANAELKKFLTSINLDVQTELNQEGIQWHFIPPKSPHFGGLWEAGVKSVKHHLKRVIGESKLTFEEYSTVLAQVEACLNSRPLYPLSSDPNDPNPITPAHFLIGEPLQTVPCENFTGVKESILSRFKRCQKIVQDVWQRWSKEYISELQIRHKWKKNHPQLLKPDTVVIIKEDNLPPLKWSLGRVLQLHPGSDGVVRVATIKTSSGVYKRPVAKLCVLPNSAEQT